MDREHTCEINRVDIENCSIHVHTAHSPAGRQAHTPIELYHTVCAIDLCVCMYVHVVRVFILSTYMYACMNMFTCRVLTEIMAQKELKVQPALRVKEETLDSRDLVVIQEHPPTSLW